MNISPSFHHNVVWFASINRPHTHSDVTLQLIEEFLRGIDVKIVARVGSAGDEDDDVGRIIEELLVADRAVSDPWHSVGSNGRG